jgi:hypothetical protein
MQERSLSLPSLQGLNSAAWKSKRSRFFGVSSPIPSSRSKFTDAGKGEEIAVKRDEMNQVHEHKTQNANMLGGEIRASNALPTSCKRIEKNQVFSEGVSLTSYTFAKRPAQGNFVHQIITIRATVFFRLPLPPPGCC